MTYVVKLTAPMEREERIEKALKSPLRTEAFYDFRTAKIDLPVVRVPIDLPVYRMENFRTYTDQKEYIAKEKKAHDFFSTGQESEAVQQVQHSILDRLARKGVADSVVPVIDVLESEGQREAILITSQGVVVNGNRRLAGFREIGTQHLDVMVLPSDASADEIVDIEASLQGRPETKLDYDWIGDGQLINRLIGMGRTSKQVADQLRRAEKDIRNSLQALTEVDLYLKEWAKAEGEYSRVREDAEQLFKDLPRRIEGKSAKLAQASRVIAWTLFDNKEKLPGRIYDFNAAFGKLTEEILNRTAEELEIDTNVSPEPDDNATPFDVDLGDTDGDEGVISYDALIAILTDGSKGEAAVDALIEAAQGAIEADKGQKSGESAFKALVQANGKMAAVDLSRASKDTYGKIKKQLDTIDDLSKKLRTQLTQLETSK